MDLSPDRAYNVNGAYVYFTDGKDILRYKIGSNSSPKKLNVEPTFSEHYIESIQVLPRGIYFNQSETGWAYRLDFEGKVTDFVSMEQTEPKK